MDSLLILPCRFIVPGQFGDFMYMKDLPKYKKTLFIFNDNVESKYSTCPGAGNAVMRQFNWNSCRPPRSHGIPTGHNGFGFSKLDKRTKEYIDASIKEIEYILKLYRDSYDCVAYSTNVDPLSHEFPLIGQSIFKIDDAIRLYITNCIWKLKKINE